MIKQIYNLTKIQLRNLYGINVFRFSKDKKEKNRKKLLAIAYLVLLAFMMFYVGMMAYGYIMMGLGEILPAYLIMITSLIILFFSVFKAGSVIFQKNGYDILASFPLMKSAIVVSRFIRMYIENLLLTFIIMIPAMCVYGIMLEPSVSFYLIGVVVTIFIPLIPITLATFIGALITTVASRMKHKNFVNASLSILLVLGMVLCGSRMTSMEDSFSIEMMQNLLETVFALIEGIYPPAIWLGKAMLTGNVLSCLLCVVIGLAVFVFVMAIVSINYEWISRGLYSTNAKHEYQMGELTRSTILGAMYKREVKRYVSSSVYVTNTIMGPVMAVLFSLGMLVLGQEQMKVMFEMPFDIAQVMPFGLAVIFCIMPTTCTSISMEGKEWWIMKSLPLKTKDVLDSKILLNLSLVLPFYFLSEIIIIIAVKPNVIEVVWMIIIPALMILFSSVFGITANLKFPVFNWENEVTIVKQSASALLGGIVGSLIVLLCAVPVLFTPERYATLVKLVVCVLIASVTWVLYQKNNQVNFQQL